MPPIHPITLFFTAVALAGWSALSPSIAAEAEPPAVEDNTGSSHQPSLSPSEQAEILYSQGKYVEAAQIYAHLAEQGDAKAQTRLGTMTLQGQGVDKNVDQGVAWYVKAARQGEAEAQNKLGQLYMLTKDYSQALVWFRKAAVQGFADAQYNLGVMSEKGLGQALDREQAIFWYRKAASSGHERARKYLIRLGVSRNDSPWE